MTVKNVAVAVCPNQNLHEEKMNRVELVTSSYSSGYWGCVTNAMKKNALVDKRVGDWSELGDFKKSD